MARKDAHKGRKEELAERRIKSLELRKAGLSYRAIGEQLGITESQAWGDVKAALKRLAKVEQGHAQEYRQLELERIDALLNSLWLKAKGRRYHDPETGALVEVEPDYKALDRVMKLMQDRRKLLNLDLQPEEQQDTEITIRVVYGKGVGSGDDGS